MLLKTNYSPSNQIKMKTIELIRFIAVFAHENPTFKTVVIDAQDDMTIDESIEDLIFNHAAVTDWSVNTTDCRNTILVY